jgi:uncharacterized protein YndB with AHSA1/START domain
MTRTITPAPVRKSIEVRAAPARAFRFFTARIGQWWPPSHSILGVPPQDVVIEPAVGGRWYERGRDGSECDWGRVLAWEPPHRLVLSWQIDGTWHYDPALVTEVEIRFIPAGAATRVELEHRHLERFGDRAAATRDALDSPEGWEGIIRAYAARTEAGA